MYCGYALIVGVPLEYDFSSRQPISEIQYRIVNRPSLFMNFD